MIRKGFLLGFAAGLIGLGRLSAGAAAELRALDLVADGDGAQLTLDLTDAAGAKLFTLENPDRAVLDLPGTQLAGGVHVPTASGVVTELRLGNQPGGVLRVVLELKSALPARAAWGAGGRRLVLVVGLPGAATASTVAPAAEQPPSAVRAAHAPVTAIVTSSSRSMRGMAGRIPVRSAVAERARRMSPSRSHGHSPSASMPSPACVRY